MNKSFRVPLRILKLYLSYIHLEILQKLLPFKTRLASVDSNNHLG